MSPCLFNFYEEYVIQNAGLDESQAGIKIAGRYTYLWLIHVDVWQKPTQFCKAIILQLKINNIFFKKRLPGKKPTTSDMQMIPAKGRKQRGTKQPL